MGRYLRYAWLLALALVCLIVAMANRAPVTLSLLPDDLAGLLNWQLRVELPREILRAREHGDLSENAEYHAAKERQAWVNARLAQLNRVIKNAV